MYIKYTDINNKFDICHINLLTKPAQIISFPPQCQRINRHKQINNRLNSAGYLISAADNKKGSEQIVRP